MSNINQKLKNKTVFITGGNNGIGEGSSKYLASVGLNVIIFGRNKENGLRVEKEINELKVGKALFIQGDVTSEEDQRKALEEGEKIFGSIDFVFANAGIAGKFSDLLTDTISDYKNMFETNFFGAVITLQQATPFLKKNGGVVVFNSSIGSLMSRTQNIHMPIFQTYRMTKYALDGFIKISTSLEKSHNIKVFGVNPSTFVSGMTTQIPNKTVEELAQFNTLIKRPGYGISIGKVLEPLFDGTTKYVVGSSIVCETEYTVDAQFFHENYFRETLDTKDLLYNHLRDSRGDKLPQEKLEELEKEINILNEKFKNGNNSHTSR
eukprot:TRINITY_DN3141_c0_g2_i1.p1 TRINITY_DN3141_c0_g2~~TRINITY_DN3141_c0_g2_i1.p1  ORF type:complete len:321 (+),score=106.03 TRINITY_DN3141_c0_g2_i1:43-1005(+)